MDLATANTDVRFVVKDDAGFDRIAFAEVIVPNVVDPSYGDFHTKESVRSFAYTFMLNQFGWDREHDGIDLSDFVRIVESFIAREGDPDFIEGSWVVGIHIDDDDLWNAVLDGEINGFSYEAFVRTIPVMLSVYDNRIVYGSTEEDPRDGHSHQFLITLGKEGNVLFGGTAVVDGHSHAINRATYTEEVDGHSHRFNVIQGLPGGV